MRSANTLIPWVVVGTILGMACKNGNEPTAEITTGKTGTLVGHLEGPGGVPPSRALVAVFSADAKAGDAWREPVAVVTTENGRFRVDNLSQGTYSVSVASREQCAAYVRDLQVQHATETEFHVKAEEPCVALKGTVSSRDATALTRGYVTVMQQQRPYPAVLVVDVDEDGGFATRIQPGWYTIGGRYPGFTAGYEVVDAREDLSIGITMDPHASANETIAARVIDDARKLSVPIDLDRNRLPEAILAGLREASVVALGESTHGTSEFVTANELFALSLVNEGYGVIAIEAAFTNTLRLDDYVQGNGSEDEAIGALQQWRLNSDEFRLLAETLRSLNRKAKKPVSVVGIDIPTARASVNWLLQYLQRVDPDTAGKVAPALEELAEERHHLEMDEADEERARMSLTLVDRAIEAFRSGHETEESEVAAHVLSLLRASEASMAAADGRYPIREKAMAEGIRWIRSTYRPGAKVVVFSHNSHIARANDGRRTTPMGGYLAAQLGDRYIAIGGFTEGGRCLVYNQGRLRAVELPAPPAASIEALLSGTNHDAAYLDFKGSEALSIWGRTYRPTRDVGSVFIAGSDLRSWTPFVPPVESFDGGVFIRHTTPLKSKGLPADGRTGGLTKLAAPANLDFEESASGTVIPTGWETTSWSTQQGYASSLHEGGDCYEGNKCAEVTRRQKTGQKGSLAFGNIFQRFDAKTYRGTRVTFIAAVRIEAGKDTRAHLWVRIDGEESAIALENMQDFPITGSDWNIYSTRPVTVPDTADAIAVGMMVYGPGSAFLDNCKVTAQRPPG